MDLLLRPWELTSFCVRQIALAFMFQSIAAPVRGKLYPSHIGQRALFVACWSCLGFNHPSQTSHSDSLAVGDSTAGFGEVSLILLD